MPPSLGLTGTKATCPSLGLIGTEGTPPSLGNFTVCVFKHTSVSMWMNHTCGYSVECNGFRGSST